MTFTPARGPLVLRRWLAAGHLLHGSPCAELTELVPQAGTHDPWVDCDGPVVYATEDPVIAVLFALLDRDRWCGALDIEVNPRGYQFAVDATGAPLRPAGTVWVVPRDGFHVLPGRDDALTQWASDRPVRPLAAIAVQRRQLRVPVTARGAPSSVSTLGDVSPVC